MNEIIGIDVEADLDTLPLGDMDLSELAILHKDGKLWNFPLSSLFYVGSWTPTIGGSTTSGTQTYTLQEGDFIKIGTFVFCTCRVTISAKDAGIAGNVHINGLPYLSANAASRAGVSIGAMSGITFTAGYTAPGGYVSPNSHAIVLTQIGSGQPLALIPVSQLASACDLMLSFSYLAAA